jgi:hypothetical protein
MSAADFLPEMTALDVATSQWLFRTLRDGDVRPTSMLVPPDNAPQAERIERLTTRMARGLGSRNLRKNHHSSHFWDVLLQHQTQALHSRMVGEQYTNRIEESVKVAESFTSLSLIKALNRF